MQARQGEGPVALFDRSSHPAVKQAKNLSNFITKSGVQSAKH